jgi:DNA-binding MarR family transcriptional regulator
MDDQSSGRTLQDQMIALIRAFALHRPDTTPCGQPVTIAEAHALLELQRDEPLSQQELGQRLHLEKSTVSRLVSLLEGREWIIRTRSEVDARVVKLGLSTEGQAAAAQLSASRAEKFGRVLAAIPPEQREQVIAALEILVGAMRENNQSTE